MAVNNTTLGSVLNIPDDLFKKFDDIDKRLEQVSQNAKKTAISFKGSFDEMNLSISPVLTNLGKIVTGINSLSKGMTSFSTETAKATTGINSLQNVLQSSIEIINKMRLLVQAPPSNGGFVSHLNTLLDAFSIRISGMGTKFKDFKKQLLELDTAAMQQAMKAQSDAKIKLINEQTATILAKENLEQAKQNRLYAQAATEAAKLARAQAQLAQARAMAATAQERATAANERAARRATIRQYGADATSAMSYVNNSANTGTFNQRAIAIKVLEEAIKNLNKTDRDYQKNLQELSNKYRELKAEQDKVISSYREMKQHHRSLVDTAGQLQRAFALMFSVSQIRGYISQIAKVRGEFELQQRSLEAILQNKTEADAIFNKTIALAVQSPFQIKDLISYTKQLAAYRIESDKLYDTTKRLADVSAGLGVDMQRLILAYGQVKAAAYLRGTEVRQFTEAGINLYGELQAYFKEVKGEAYTTAQIVDMISKRMVTFEDIEAIFKRITDQGGIFYNMQKIQSETLQGKIANLRDSIDVMLNDIGKANEGAFKGTIDFTNLLFRNWESVANIGQAIIGIFALVKLNSMMMGRTMTDVFLSFAKFQKLSASTNVVNMLSVAFKNVGAAATSAGRMISMAFTANAGLLGIMAGVTAVYSLFKWVRDYREELQKVAVENGKLRKQIVEITNAFDEAGKLDGDNGIAAKEKALERLKKLVADADLKVKISVEESKDVDAYFSKLKSKYEEYIKFKRVAETALVDNNQRWEWGGLLGDNIDEDAKNFTDAYNTIIGKTSELDAAVSMLYDRYDKLSDVQKKILDEGTKRQEGQSEMEYLRQQSEAAKKVTELFGVTLDSSKVGIRSYLLSIFDSYNSYDNAKSELISEVNGIIETIKMSYTKTEWEKVGKDVISRVITGMAADKGWTDEVKDILYKAFNIPITLDGESAKREGKRILDLIQDEFDKKKIKINIKTDLLDPSAALDEIKDITKSVGEWEELIGNIQRGTMRYWNGKQLGINAPMQVKGWKGVMDSATVFSKEQALEFAKQQLEIAKLAKKEVGGQSKEDRKALSDAEKAQRDLIKERIEAYKELQSQYEKYLKMYDKGTAKTKALESLKYKLQNAGIYGDAVGIFPDEKTIAEKIKGLAAQYKDLSKRGDAYKVVADLLLKIDENQLEKELDAAKNQIDDAFSGLNVYTDLKKLGLGESDIAKMFGDYLPKTFDDVQNKIAEVYNGKEGPKWAKQREETEKKLQEQIVKYNLDTFKELTNKYKTQLSDQLQLDAWYYEEKQKIMQNEQLKANPKMQSEYLSNLNKQYKQKSSENTWKAFKGSDMYINMFEDLEHVSTKALNNMKSALENVKSSIGNLNPSNLKELMSLFNKMDEEIIKRDPVGSLISSLKEIKRLKNLGTTEESLNEDNIRRNKQNLKVSDDINKLNKIIQLKKTTVDLSEDEQAFIEENKEQYTKTEDELKGLIKDKKDIISLNEKEIAKNNDSLKIYAKARASIEATMTEYQQLLSLINNASSSISKIMEALGEETDSTTMSFVNMAGNLTDLVVQAILFHLQLQLCAASATAMGIAVNSALGPIGWAVLALQAVATVLTTILGNSDKSTLKEIEKLEGQVKRLQKAYEKLKKQMDDAWDISGLIKYKNEAIDTLKATNKSLESMIKLEMSRKNTDWSKIDAWNEQIRENLDAIEELEENAKEQLGGFGSDANFKSAAQEFADAWVDAFNEGEDALDALNKKLDDFIDNLIKKQIMLRLSDKYIKPILDEIDKSLEKESPGGANITREELKNINSLRGNLDEYNETAKLLFQTLGLTPNASTSLSMLQQGIQSLTEERGQALESLLNSIRFFVAQQTTDVAAIRQMLAISNGVATTNETNNPTLTELRSQTNILMDIRNAFNSIIKSGGHPKIGSGVKVFID